MNLLPSSLQAKLVAKICHRRLTTPWDKKEIKRFRELQKQGFFENKEGMENLERYCEAERRKGERGIYRRDLFTFLNNIHGEMDRADDWALRHPKPRKIIPLPPIKTNEPALPIEPETRDKFLADFELRRGRKLWQPNQ